jgi:hypothetical protein
VPQDVRKLFVHGKSIPESVTGVLPENAMDKGVGKILHLVTDEPDGSGGLRSRANILFD